MTSVDKILTRISNIDSMLSQKGLFSTEIDAIFNENDYHGYDEGRGDSVDREKFARKAEDLIERYKNGKLVIKQTIKRIPIDISRKKKSGKPKTKRCKCK